MIFFKSFVDFQREREYTVCIQSYAAVYDCRDYKEEVSSWKEVIMKRFLSSVLSILMVLSVFTAFPAGIFAADSPAVLVIKPSGFGAFENWANSPNLQGEYDAVTQLLVEATDSEGAALSLPANAKWFLTISSAGGSTTIEMNPATTYAPSNLYRFEVCNGTGENKFVPVKGTTYTVSAEIYSGDALIFKSEAVSGFTCNIDPIDPAVPLEEPQGTVSLSVAPYYGHIENWGTPEKTFFIVGTTAASANYTLYQRLKRGTYALSVTVTDETTNTTAVIDYPFCNPAQELYQTSFLRLSLAERGFVPVADHSYTVKLDVYDGEELKYTGSSAVGAFKSTNTKFIENGAIVPELPPVNKDSVLYGKSVLFVGDSITEAICEVNIPALATAAGWPGRIGMANNMLFVNKGLSGASISNVRGTNTVLAQLQSMKNRDFDLLIMHGGVNDAWDEAPVGQMTALDNFDGTTFDQSTFAGGLEYLFWYAKTYYPDAVKGYIINFRLPGSSIGKLSDMSEYFSVARQICDKWEIPYLDMYANDELNDRMKATTRYALGDYIHPNDRGYDILYPYVEDFCECIMEGKDPATLTDPERLPDGSSLIDEDDVNVALGKPVVSGSGTKSTVPTDGRVDAYFYAGDWGSEDEGSFGTDGECYIQIDLGYEYLIDKLNVVTFVGNLLYQWEAYATTDATLSIDQWTKLGAKDGYEMSYEDGYTLTFEEISARYVRIYGIYDNASTAFVFNEVSVYGTPSVSTDENLVEVGGGSTATLPDKSTSDKLTDGNKTSDPLVVTPTDGGSILYDLGAVVMLETIKTYTAGTDSSYGIYGSLDGKEWTLLATKEVNGTSEAYDAAVGWCHVMAVSGSYRYLRWQWLESKRADGYVSAAEIEIFAKDSETALTGITATATDCVYSGNNTLDGNYKSYCFMNRKNDGTVVDLTTAKDLRYVTLYPASTTEDLLVAVSADNRTWVTVGYARAGNTEAIDMYLEGSYRYLKLYTDKGVGYEAYELEVYMLDEEEPDVPVDPPTDDPSVDPEELTAKEEVTITNGATGGLAPGLKDGNTSGNYTLIKEGDGCFALIDLQKSYTLTKAVIYALNGKYLFEIYGSNDKESWTKLGANEESSSYVAADGFVLDLSGDYRYVKVVGTGCQYGYFTTYEMDIFGHKPVLKLESVIDDHTTVTVGGSATDKLTDGNKTSDGATIVKPAGGQVTLDLGEVKEISKLEIHIVSMNNGSFGIYASENGEDWVYLDTKAIDDTRVVNSCLTVQVNDSYRYVKVVGLDSKRTDVYSCAICELDVFDKDGNELALSVSSYADVVYQNNIKDGNNGNYTFIKKAAETDLSVVVDLKGVKALRRIVVHAANGNQLFLLETSVDGQNYLPFGENAVMADYDPAVGFVIDVDIEVEARYVRLTPVDGFGSDRSYTLYEIDALVKVTEKPVNEYDINKDGTATIADVAALLDHLAGKGSVEGGDLNGDGGVTIADVATLLDHLAGK